MSYHVYVSREGFKDNPISMDQWLAAARQCNELVVEEPHVQQDHFKLVRSDYEKPFQYYVTVMTIRQDSFNCFKRSVCAM